MSDSTNELGDTYREIGHRPTGDGMARTLMLRQHYDAPVGDVWDACTKPEQLTTWFLPVTGDLSIGGTFSFEDNASGQIMRCEPPDLVAVTWSYGEGPASEVVLRLAAKPGDQTALELEHGPIPEWVDMDGRLIDPVLNDADTGFWGLGTGWEMAMISLGRYLRGDVSASPQAEVFNEDSPEVERLADACGRAWTAVVAETAVQDQP